MTIRACAAPSDAGFSGRLHDAIGRVLRRVFVISGGLLIIDLGLAGQGVSIPGSQVSLRRILFVALLGTAVLLKLHSAGKLDRNDALLPVVLGLLAAVWVVVIPLSFGFPASFSLRDFLPWSALLLLVAWPTEVFPTAEHWRRVRRFVSRVAVVLAVLHLFIWALLTLEIIPVVAVWAAMAAVAGGQTDGDTFFMIGPLPDESMRVYWSSSIFMLIGLYFLLTQRDAVRRRWGLGRWDLRRWLAIALIAAALWITYLRALIGGMLLWALVVIATRWFLRKPPPGSAALLTVGAWALAIISVSIAIRPEVLEFLGIARDVSDSWRIQQSAALIGQFAASPLVGSGFGSFTPALLSSLAAPFSYELTFHALLMKLGVLGFLVFAIVLYSTVASTGCNTVARTDPKAYWNWVGFTTALWFCGATNPVVTNFVGMAVLVLALLDMKYRSLAVRRARS